LRDGVRIVIAGPPNVGKSSLLNALAKRDVAIVSEEAGTTRDVLEVHLDLGGLPVILTDTAGLRETESKVEAEGVRRALSRTEQADVVLWLVDATAPVWEPPVALGTKPAICILNKIDLGPQGTSEDCIQISAKTGQGLDRLIEVLEEQAALIAKTGSGAPLMTRARHRVELEDARAALQRFGDAPLSPELRAEELRIAAHHVGRLTGRIDVEEVLGAIFGEFCIGK
jgi:tRNA modification GTPase